MPNRKNNGDVQIGSFNVRGISTNIAKENLINDLERYKLDLCCLQETKIRNGCDVNIEKHRLICFPSKCKDYGMGLPSTESYSRSSI